MCGGTAAEHPDDRNAFGAEKKSGEVNQNYERYKTPEIAEEMRKVRDVMGLGMWLGSTPRRLEKSTGRERFEN